ncbi:MAG: aldehyde dehydrogenase family protein, partial [Chloroflexota bacterium]
MAITLDRPGVASAPAPLAAIPKGMPILFGGNRVTTVPDAIADAFRPGDRLIVVQASGDVLHIPANVYDLVDHAVRRTRAAFEQLAVLPDDHVDRFYDHFAARLADDA